MCMVFLCVCVQTQEEVTGSTKVSCGLRPVLSSVFGEDINHAKLTGSSLLQKAFCFTAWAQRLSAG